MPAQYVLIDYENVQPKNLALLDGQPFEVIVFLGANQKNISSELADMLQRRGKLGRYVRATGNGHNALDFHIAFYLGELAEKNSGASFHVISKDEGFDPLLKHLRSRQIDVRRSASLAALAPPLAASAPPDDKLADVIAHLRSMGESRPKKVKKLSSTINALFGKRLDENEIRALIDALEQRHEITVKDSKVTYRTAGRS